jgi:hypothetical protein
MENNPKALVSEDVKWNEKTCVRVEWGFCDSADEPSGSIKRSSFNSLIINVLPSTSKWESEP